MRGHRGNPSNGHGEEVAYRQHSLMLKRAFSWWLLKNESHGIRGATDSVAVLVLTLYTLMCCDLCLIYVPMEFLFFLWVGQNNFISTACLYLQVCVGDSSYPDCWGWAWTGPAGKQSDKHTTSEQLMWILTSSEAWLNAKVMRGGTLLTGQINEASSTSSYFWTFNFRLIYLFFLLLGLT